MLKKIVDNLLLHPCTNVTLPIFDVNETQKMKDSIKSNCFVFQIARKSATQTTSRTWVRSNAADSLLEEVESKSRSTPNIDLRRCRYNFLK